MKIQKSTSNKIPNPDEVYEMLSNSTLNEEIGMSQQGIDYVNSLEVKEEIYANIWENNPQSAKTVFTKEQMIDLGISNNLPDMVKEIEQQRIRKQARNAWICVFMIIAITVILNWKS